MATIKLQNGKVITKDGKVSCSCCYCNNEFDINSQNVFEITKEEHNAYRRGGVWNISGIQSLNELVSSQTPICTSNGSDLISYSINKSESCSYDINFSTNAQQTYAGPCSGNYTQEYSFETTVNISLRYINKKFYVKYIMNSNVSSSELTSSPFGYPAVVDFSVDGNQLIAFGNWNPSWQSYPSYVNTSSITIEAIFTPNP
jgi:hypothetical protein